MHLTLNTRDAQNILLYVAAFHTSHHDGVFTVVRVVSQLDAQIERKNDKVLIYVSGLNCLSSGSAQLYKIISSP
jgi:hypothetical protein